MITMQTRLYIGQNLTSYVTGLICTILEDETDRPDKLHLFNVDNCHINIIGTELQEALHCIRCAACINVCPVYRHIGGHAYGSIYPGPIGAVLTPLLGGYDDYEELPFASSLCGACTEVCPVKIPLHEHLISHRRHIIEDDKRGTFSENLMMKGFGTLAKSSGKFNTATKFASTGAKPFVKDGMIEKGPGPLKDWTVNRDMMPPQKQRFRDWYRKREGEK